MDKKTDYCGPAGDSKLAKAISAKIPDELFGVYLGDCCKEHDDDIDINGPNKSGDIKFRSCIKCKIVKAVKFHWLAKAIAYSYYAGGRIGAARHRL